MISARRKVARGPPVISGGMIKIAVSFPPHIERIREQGFSEVKYALYEKYVMFRNPADFRFPLQRPEKMLLTG